MSFVKEMTFQESIEISSAMLLEELFTNKVLVLRNSGNIENYVNLMKKLGKIIAYDGPQFDSFHPPGYPEVLRIANLYIDGKGIGVHEEGNKFYLTQWHTHFSYKTENKVVSALQAHQIHQLQDGSGTEFIDCVGGLNTLREAIAYKSIDLGVDLAALDALVVKHAYGNANKYQQDNYVKHPLIINHPVTNQQSIYAIASTAIGIEGFSTDESKIILDKIQNFLAENAPRYVHEYQKGDIVIWDNLTTLHRGPVIKASTSANDCRILYLTNVDWGNAANLTKYGNNINEVF